MTDRPIIFSAPMVLALLAGRKTQTRRLATSPLRRCERGDRLYVRECFFVMSDDYGWADYVSRQGCQPDRTIGYRADQSDGPMVKDQDWEPPRNAKREVHGLKGEDDAEAWTLIGDVPSIYMPRWASRLTLIVEDVRVQRLQEISESDARAEGVVRSQTRAFNGPKAGIGPSSDLSHRQAYAELWESLHGADSWAANPEVVALTFSVERGNIDRLRA